MPITSHEDRQVASLERRDISVERCDDLAGSQHWQIATRQEILLYVDDEQRITRVQTKLSVKHCALPAGRPERNVVSGSGFGSHGHLQAGQGGCTFSAYLQRVFDPRRPLAQARAGSDSRDLLATLFEEEAMRSDVEQAGTANPLECGFGGLLLY